MNTTRCPLCNNPLSESAQYCADCDGAIVASEREVTQAERSQGKRRETAVLVHAPKHADTLKLPHLDLLGGDSGNTPSDSVTNETPPELVATPRRARSSVQTAPSKKERRRSGNRRTVDDDWSVLDLPATWHKEVAPSPNRSKAAPLPPRPVRARVRMLGTKQGPSWLRKLPPAVYMWASILVLLVVVFSGILGLVVTRGKGIDKAGRTSELALQVSPGSVSVGATVLLKGVNFSPRGHISLSRDNSISIVDTDDDSITDADGQGNFSDTVAIPPDWGAGQHTINAEDLARHKVTSFSLLVTGHATSLRPAHLFVSVSSIDLGSGDQLTNTVKTLTLEDVGGGQISWQGSSTQPWLVLSPNSGTFASGQSAQVNVAIDRSKMQPGHYKAQIDLLSNAGQSTISVSAEVTRILPGHMAMLQLSPAVLSFTGTNSGVSPAMQTVTVSNPGQQRLQWQATSNASWLYALQQEASVNPSGSMSVPIGVNTKNLLPGTYSGMVTFSARGTAMGSPQSLLVTVTVMPQCALQFSPGLLRFAGEYQGLAPASQTMTLGTYANCKAPLAWHATSNANWLTISSSKGTVPARPVLGINSANLKPGIYMSSILFSSAAGTQTFPVIFTLGQKTGPLVVTTPGALAFNATGGQPALQRVSLLNNGSSGSLTWRATIANGGNWLAVSPAGGHLAPHQSAALSINVRNLSTLSSGTYRGAVTITGVDRAGAQVLGSPRTIPVSLVVKSSCAIAATPNGLSFTRTRGVTGHVVQPVTILANTACTDLLSWSTTTVTSSGGKWLTATAMGSVGSKSSGRISVRVSSSSLGVGNYTGKVIVTATDTITKQVVGRVVPVALRIQAAPALACTLQMPSTRQENFTTYSGANPTVQSFTISANGGCGSAITITSSAHYTSGSGWLAASPGSSSVSVGGAAAFTVHIASAALPTGTYAAYISLTAKTNGTALLNSPRTVRVVLNVLKRPTVHPPPPTPQPTPTPPPKIDPTPTPSPVTTASPTPTATATSTTAQATATSTTTPTVTPTSTAQATATVEATPLPPQKALTK